MDKTSQKVTKDLKRQEQNKKAYETHMERLKDKILGDKQPPAPPPTGNPTPSTSPPTGNPAPSTSSLTRYPTPSTSSHATRSNDNYVYGVGMLAVLAIGVCVFFAYNTFQSKNKK